MILFAVQPISFVPCSVPIKCTVHRIVTSIEHMAMVCARFLVFLSSLPFRKRSKFTRLKLNYNQLSSSLFRK